MEARLTSARFFRLYFDAGRLVCVTIPADVSEMGEKLLVAKKF